LLGRRRFRSRRLYMSAAHLSLAFQTLTLRPHALPQCRAAAAAATAAVARLARRGGCRRVAPPEKKDMTRSADKHANTKVRFRVRSVPFCTSVRSAGCE
jgi:hypothetical protein